MNNLPAHGHIHSVAVVNMHNNFPTDKERTTFLEQRLLEMWKNRREVADDVTYELSSTYRGKAPLEYYHFLNTFVLFFQCNQILEFGTHKAGSTLAMMSEIPGKQKTVITFDIVHHALAEERLEQDFVEYRVENPLDKVTSEFVREKYGAGDGDVRLMFIDGEKSYSFVSRSIQLGLEVFNADYIIIDDINFPEVGKDKLISQYGNSFIDLCELLGNEIRQTGYVDSGFGLVLGRR